MRLPAYWKPGQTGYVVLEYAILALIVGIALVVGCANLRTAFLVGSVGQTGNQSVTTDDGDPKDPAWPMWGG